MINFDFVIFMDVDWESNTQKNRQHFLITELARKVEGNSRVLGVERSICPWTTPFRKWERFIQWLCRKRGLRQVGKNLYIYTPFVLIHNVIADRIPGMTMLNQCVIKAFLSRVLKKLEFRTENLIAWIHHPYQLEDIELVREKKLIYDCYDDYLVYEQNPVRRHDIQEREQAIQRRADCIFVTSKELLVEKGKTNKNVHLLPNAVEYEHFVQASQGGKSLGPQYDGPVLGFTGKITQRLDFRLLTRIAVAHPNWNLVIIGPQENDACFKQNPDYRDFVTTSNILLLGAIPYQELPAQMRSFDVCLLPYTASDPFNISCSPLKLYEYLATGKPIVTTDLLAVRLFDGLVRIAQNDEEFEQLVVEALQEKDDLLRQKRLVAAQENSWEKRAEQMIAIMEKCL